MPQPNVALLIPDAEWFDAGPKHDPTARLMCTVYVNRCPMHAEAWAVCAVDDEETGGTVQTPVVWPEKFEAVYRGVQADGPWATVGLRGREYVIIITPHCD